MTYLLVCAICAGTPGQIASQGAGPEVPRLAFDLDRDTSSLDLERDASALGLALAAPVPFADHSGHDGGGSRIGPMWIMMGVMMVAMMVVLGVYMMRGNAVGPFEFGAISPPHLAAIPFAGGFRPGG